MHRDYHRPTDDVDKINFEALGQVVDVAVDVLDRIDQLPRQSYVSTFDSKGMTIGASGGGKRATLGVMPDYNSDSPGLRITDVVPDSPAAAAGMKAGDVIMKIGESKIQTAYDLMEFLQQAKAGQKIHIAVTREGKPLELDATLKDR
jgi:S1-C subfamily serine protease